MRRLLFALCCACLAAAAPFAALAAAPAGKIVPAPADRGIAAERDGAPDGALDGTPDGALSRSQIRTATAALAAAGYAPGPVDGDWDAADRAALSAYQADWELPETGEPTAELLGRLTREHPETEPRWVETDTGCRVWNRFPQARETVRWTGDCVDGLTSGKGVLTWTATLRGETQVETYAGQRRDGREDGHGVYTGADGSRYSGEWRAGLKHGQGIFMAPQGHVYVGGYRDGLRDGEGTYVRAEGSRYEGEWRAGLQEGRGVAVWHDGSRYEGELRGGKPEGRGTLTFTDGNVYSGEWRAGCFAEATRGATAGVTQAECGWR